ncbi:MAG: hypothetical protein NZL93_06820, partial [Chthoniobacterales bacterium]|nr:hypothetical protein [Chthoniobacterales bacterium]
HSKWPDHELCVFGHIGDGNLHVNVMKPPQMSKEEFFARSLERDQVIFELVRAYGGSISAEHGIGLLKKQHLHFSRTPEEIKILKSIKSIFDPNGILNPGKVLPDDTYSSFELESRKDKIF